MDRMIYTAMTGAKHILEQQTTNSHNLANATSTGFRAQLDSFRAVPIVSEGLPTRAFVVDATVGSDFTPGPLQQTGRDLDVAIQGKGWLSVIRPDGSEAYTRNGSLKVSENGVLQTANGLTLMGDGGPIGIPPDETISVGKDGTISTVSNNYVPGAINVLGRLKLVNPPEESMVRGNDGLFELKSGEAAEVDPQVHLVGGALEGSNVNVVEAMVNMISLARQFDSQMRLLEKAENNADKASQLLSLTS
ncbi:MAG: flagellar biosynthesis protein FlgF [Betaproteobacteria bacterium HGW-Betaproteobacteria-8]|nr:MAG: flagellar biosynthesis protein FlgF [Betaproteobacteria bacterium HGW-Betaproteobacteria-8]